MAVIHHTTLTPGKLDLLAAWLPSQPWYVATGRPLELIKAGGFRLDDPAGEVGIEFMVVTDQSGAQPASYHVPMTYRAARLAGAEHALIGKAEHGVLGTRWIYDGAQDPVLTAQLIALLQGAADAQAQSVTDTPDPSVVRHFTGTDLSPAGLRIIRQLQPGLEDPGTSPAGSRGYVECGWQLPDGTAVRGRLVGVLDQAAAGAE
ncbi:MAG TPA: 1,4-alpha-glucan branching protein [Streptosporangiaceae bacterium]|jgi:hypothetical protein